MAIREFDGIDDFIRLDGTYDINTASKATTLLILAKPTTQATSSEAYISVGVSTTSTYASIYHASTTQLIWGSSDPNNDAIGTVTPTTAWQIFAITKAAGSALPRVHRKVLGSGSWTRVNSVTSIDVHASATVANQVYLGRFNNLASFRDFRLAVAAIFDRALTDTELDGIEAAASTVSISALAPLEVWDFNQASIGTSVVGLRSGFNQGAITGTTVVTGDDPPGWTFGLPSSSYQSAVLADNPSLYWRLNESAGTNANDETANNRDGTYASGTGLGVLGATGDGNTAIMMDADGEGVTSTYNPYQTGTVRTFEGWAFRTATVNAGTLAGSSANRQILYVQAGSNDVVFSADNAGGAATTTWTNAWPGDNQWVHWVCVFDDPNNQVSLYINGSLKSTQSNAGVFNATPGTFYAFKSQFPNQSFQGRGDEIAVYEYGLSADRIAAHFNAAVMKGATAGMFGEELAGNMWF